MHCDWPLLVHAATPLMTFFAVCDRSVETPTTFIFSFGYWYWIRQVLFLYGVKAVVVQKPVLSKTLTASPHGGLA